VHSWQLYFTALRKELFAFVASISRKFTSLCKFQLRLGWTSNPAISFSLVAADDHQFAQPPQNPTSRISAAGIELGHSAKFSDSLLFTFTTFLTL
jgi:hypothetical protein